MTRWCDHKITFSLDRDVSDSRVYITFRQNGHAVCEFSDDDDEVHVEGNTVTLTMPPHETALFSPAPATVQLNFTSAGKRQATQIMKLYVYDNLCSHELPEDGK